MRYFKLFAVGTVLGSYKYSIKDAVKKGVIRHFDHISELPTTQWYRVPQNGEIYSTFEKDHHMRSENCNMNLNHVEYNIADDIYDQEGNNIENFFPRKMSDLNWPQMDGSLVRNIYPTYMAIHGGKRQFCILRRYFGKTVDGFIGEPRNREWGPYRCSRLKLVDPDKTSDVEADNYYNPGDYNYGQYHKFIALRSGPERKYKPIINLVDIRAQADFFGPMYTRLDLDSDELHPIGKWENHRAITNYAKNDILEKYNVIKFYNAEHELFNDNSRLRLVGKEPVTIWYDMEKVDDKIHTKETRKGLMFEVDTMMPTYAFLTGGAYDEHVMSHEINSADNVKSNWFRRNMVPNYISRSFKSGFMRTGTLIGGYHEKYDRDLASALDQPGNNRPCCTNSVSGYEGYNVEDTRKKGVGYMYQPTFAPFWLTMSHTTCDTADEATECSEEYIPWINTDGGPQFSEVDICQKIQLKRFGEDATCNTRANLANDGLREYLDEHVARNDFASQAGGTEESFWAYFYTGNQNELIKHNFIEEKGVEIGLTDYADNKKRNDKNADFWIEEGHDEPKMFMSTYIGTMDRSEDGCSGKNPTKVKVNYKCSATQHKRNEIEEKDASSFISANDDYQDDWVSDNGMYKKFVEKKVSGTLIDIFENDLLFNDFEVHPPRFDAINCKLSLFNDFCIYHFDKLSISEANAKCASDETVAAECSEICESDYLGCRKKMENEEIPECTNCTCKLPLENEMYLNPVNGKPLKYKDDDDNLEYEAFLDDELNRGIYYNPPDGEKKRCEFNVINPNGVSLAYAYNHYYDMGKNTLGDKNELKHTITEIKKPGDCSTIEITVDTDCGVSDCEDCEDEKPDNDANYDNYWSYNSRCVEDEWDSIYDTMFLDITKNQGEQGVTGKFKDLTREELLN